MAAGVLAGGEGQLRGDLPDRGALVFLRAGEEQHVVVDDLGASAVVALGRGSLLAFQGFLPDVVAVQLRGNGQDREEDGAHTGRGVDTGERAGEQLELDAAGLQGGGEGHEFTRVAGQAFHLVGGEDHRLVGGGVRRRR